jgi:anaerobic ribonucleoside-triphosphate reductase
MTFSCLHIFTQHFFTNYFTLGKRRRSTTEVKNIKSFITAADGNG